MACSHHRHAANVSKRRVAFCDGRHESGIRQHERCVRGDRRCNRLSQALHGAPRAAAADFGEVAHFRGSHGGFQLHARVDPAVYKTLLESTKAIPWKIDWSSLQFAYIGPQIEKLLGWTPESWITVQDWAERIHPEDRERVVTFCVAQSQAGVDGRSAPVPSQAAGPATASSRKGEDHRYRIDPVTRAPTRSRVASISRGVKSFPHPWKPSRANILRFRPARRWHVICLMQ